jgi:hypothetical protein
MSFVERRSLLFFVHQWSFPVLLDIVSFGLSWPSARATLSAPVDLRRVRGFLSLAPFVFPMIGLRISLPATHEIVFYR